MVGYPGTSIDRTDDSTFYFKMHRPLSQISTSRHKTKISSHVSVLYILDTKRSIGVRSVFFFVQGSASLVSLKPRNFRFWASCGSTVEPDRFINESGLVSWFYQEPQRIC